MSPSFPIELSEQVRYARAAIERHLSGTLLAIHLFGSAVDGGLKPYSDIDLLVTVDSAPGESVRRALMLDLLKVSAPPGSYSAWRPLEVTVLVQADVMPWSYPAMRNLQFGEWLRRDLAAGVFEGPMIDIDLAILLTKARQHSVALVGPPAATFFAPVPQRDFCEALLDTVKQWNTVEDWEGDERNVVLALARIWYSAVTGRITAKDIAAEWLLGLLPTEHRNVMAAARAGYMGDRGVVLDAEQVAAFVPFARAAIESVMAA